MFQAMKDYWWLILIRGIVAVIFGVLVLLNPAISAVSLTVAFGFYAVASGGITWSGYFAQTLAISGPGSLAGCL